MTGRRSGLKQAAHDVLRLAQTLVPREVDLDRAKGINRRTLFVALGLFTKTSRLHHATLVLCEQGLDREAQLPARSMYEAALALQFVLRRRVTLVGDQGRLPAVPNKPLSSNFRALLYQAGDAFAAVKRIQSYERIPGLKRFARSLNKAQAMNAAMELEREIGTEWTKRLKKTSSYSGLRTIKQLATSLGCRPSYETFYWYASDAAHSGDASYYLELTDHGNRIRIMAGPEKKPSPPPTTAATSVVLTVCASLLNDRLALGRHGEIAELNAVIRACAAQR